MTTLGTLTLSDHLILDGLESAPPVAMSVRRTLGGRAIVQSVGLPDTGRELTLSGDYHFTLAEITNIRVLAQLNQPVELAHHRGIYQVLVTGIEAEAAFDYADPEDDDWYTATITMIEV